MNVHVKTLKELKKRELERWTTYKIDKKIDFCRQISSYLGKSMRGTCVPYRYIETVCISTATEAMSQDEIKFKIYS